MKVTSFYPVFITDELDPRLVGSFTALGFRQTHTLEFANAKHLTFKNEVGDRMDIAVSPEFKRFGLPEKKFQMNAVRVNVDDYEEGLAFFRERGYAVALDFDVPSAKIAVMEHQEDNNKRVFLFQHKK